MTPFRLVEKPAKPENFFDDIGRDDRSCKECNDLKRVPVILPNDAQGSTRCQTCRGASEEEIAMTNGVSPMYASADLRIEWDEEERAGVHPQNVKVAKGIQRWCEARARNGKRIMSLLLVGPYGVGKDWLAAATCKELWRLHRWPWRTVSCLQLESDVQSIYQEKDDGESLRKVRHRLLDPPVLHLMDLPREKATKSLVKLLEGVIDERLGKRLITIATSNVEVEELAQTLNYAIASRLGEECFLRVPCKGDDLRKKR